MIKIAYDSGHGMETPGKRTPLFKDGTFIHEKEFNMAAGMFFSAAAKRQGWEVIDCSPGTNDVPLKDRTKKANDEGAHVFVSFHYNAAGDGASFNQANGAMTIYSSDKKDKSIDLASDIQIEILKATGRKNLGVFADKAISGKSLAVLRNSKCPAALIEAGFMTNEKEALDMRSAVFQKKIGEAAAHGVASFLGLPFLEDIVATKPLVKIESKLKTVMVTSLIGLRVRDFPSQGGDKLAVLKYKSVCDIAEEKNGWGRIAGTPGWISLKYTKEIKKK